MNPTCTIELYARGHWHAVGQVSLHGQLSEGWKARSYAGYAVEWVFEHMGATDAHALCAQWPVGLEPLQVPHWPVFLIDMLPQGFGRAELLGRLGYSPTAGVGADWPLLMAGAGNPVGHLRVKEAAAWLQAQPHTQRGFTDEEIALRGDDFAEYLAVHGLFVAGSSGIQGEWPKLLLTRAHDGLLYLDHTLDDAQAAEHYIVKFGRGTQTELNLILQQEAPYMLLAQRLGLRVHAPLRLLHRALFIPRFDRRVVNGQVARLAQESIATLTGMPGFEWVPSHDQVCQALVAHCTDPMAEVLEYLKRDVANVALGNKDNHARNTAVQRDFDGHIALTPLFDFAPMYLHPDGIARRIRWEGNDGGRPDWARVLDRVCSDAPQTLDRARLVSGLKAMAPELEWIAHNGESLGVDGRVLAFLRPGLLAQAQALANLA